MASRKGERVKATCDLTRDLILAAVAAEGGEWTTGRVKRLYAQHRLTHVYRHSVRRDLERLTAEGYLVVNETPGRRFYTPAGGVQ